MPYEEELQEFMTAVSVCMQMIHSLQPSPFPGFDSL